MPTTKITMRQIRQALRLHFEAGLSHAQIARATGTAKATAHKFVSLARAAGVDSRVAEALSDAELERRLYRPAVARASRQLESDCHGSMKTDTLTGRHTAAAVEGVPERWILARLRNRRFFSLAELNRAIAGLLTELNGRAFKKLPGCRASAFAALGRAALRPLPATRMVIAHFKRARVNIDYHIELDGHYYVLQRAAPAGAHRGGAARHRCHRGSLQRQ